MKPMLQDRLSLGVRQLPERGVIADPDGKLVKLFDAKMPVVGMAKRHTFVIGPGRKVLEHTEGSDSVDPTKAVAACSLHPAATPAK